jgi:hypothetical protein
MGKTVEYQGYTIESAPYHLADDEKWRLRIFISLEDRRVAKTREFSADVVHATEEEANIYGIAFAQRLIEGKVEGMSVMDMKASERRATPRLRVQFRTTFSGSTKLEGTGVMRDLSTGGCRVESPVAVELGISLELRIYVPDIEWPLMIEAASVQWVSGRMFGLAFARITDTEQQRVEQLIKGLMEGGDGRADH